MAEPKPEPEPEPEPSRERTWALWSFFGVDVLCTLVVPSVPATLVGLGVFVVPVVLWLIDRPARRFSVHLTIGVLSVLSAKLLYLMASPTEFGFIAGFITVQVLIGLWLSWWGIARMRHPDPAPSRLDELDPRRFFLDTWREMDEEARIERQKRRELSLGYDTRPVVAMIVGALCLTVMEYFGGSATYQRILQTLIDQPDWAVFWDGVRDSDFGRLFDFCWWSGWRVLGYFLIPVVAIKLSRQRVRDQGLEVKGLSEHAWIYGVGYCLVFICVVIVSHTAEFSTYYPFYKLATRSSFDFVAWELLYAAQFFSLEFFFRGWWLKALKPMMGSHAIFAMIVPYCMIHYGKPFPETLGAIIAGIFLGTLAMKTRSIWSGFLIHVSVAISMDVAALIQTTGLPEQWWPV